MDAGWYNDPYGRFAQRYHDGDDWTDHVSAGDGRSFPDPSGSGPFIGGPLPFSASDAPYPGADAGGRPYDVASPWLRLAAFILDALIVGVPTFLLLMQSDIDWSVLEDGRTPAIPTSFYISSVAISAIYHIGMVGQWGRTLGKMATGITIVRAADRSAPGFGVAALRWIGFTLPGLIPYVGWIVQIVSIVLIFVDGQRQMVHDKIARTVVVKA